MTIRFELPLTKENLRERFTVEISRDGEMSFPGYEEQLEYEIAYVAMGGRKSLPLILADRWEIPAGRSHAIAHNFGLGERWSGGSLPIASHTSPTATRPACLVMVNSEKRCRTCIAPLNTTLTRMKPTDSWPRRKTSLATWSLL